jgi:hypothetical protein
VLKVAEKLELSRLLLVFGRGKEVKLKGGVPPELQIKA